MSLHQDPLHQLPHSLEAERAVLAGILLAGSPALTRVAPLIAADDLYLERHRLIWQVAQDLAGTAGLDVRTLQAELERRGELATVGGLAYLEGLDVDLPDLDNLEAYAGIVRERSLRRRLIALGTRLAYDCRDGELEGEAALARAELELRELAQQAIPTRTVSLGESAGSVLERIEEGEGRGLLGLSTGFADLDDTIHGLRPGTLVIVGGRPGTGKTTIATNIAVEVAHRQRRPVGFFSIEMTHDELTLRILCGEADVSHERLMQGHLSQRQWQALIKAARAVSDTPLYIDDDGGLDLQRLEARARRWRAELGVELIVVDHLALMSAGPGRRWSNRTEEVTAITRGVKLLAKELGIPILLLSQLSRQSERRGGEHRPMLSDLRESGSSEQDADVVLFTYREELYSRDDPSVRGLAEVIVAKNRQGRPGTVDLVFIGETFCFKSRAPEWHAAHAPPPPAPGWSSGAPPAHAATGTDDEPF